MTHYVVIPTVDLYGAENILAEVDDLLGYKAQIAKDSDCKPYEFKDIEIVKIKEEEEVI